MGMTGEDHAAMIEAEEKGETRIEMTLEVTTKTAGIEEIEMTTEEEKEETREIIGTMVVADLTLQDTTRREAIEVIEQIEETETITKTSMIIERMSQTSFGTMMARRANLMVEEMITAKMTLTKVVMSR